MNSKLSSIYAGLGMGLLLGIIMGLSISPVVKTVMGVLATALGGFLAYNKKNDASTVVEQNLRLGSFGFAVVLGIFVGLITRTNELFAPTLQERIKAWTDAGYSMQNAKRYMLFQKLGIDPNSGEAKELGDIQKTTMSNLFSSEETEMLATKFDPDKWSDIDVAIKAVKQFKILELEELILMIKKNINKKYHSKFLKQLQLIFYEMQTSKTQYSHLSKDNLEWTSETLRNISDILILVSDNEKTEIIIAMKNLFKKLESI